MSHKNAILFIVAVLCVVYGNALFNDFTGDAKSLFKNNVFYKDPAHLTKLFSKDFLMQPSEITGSYQFGKPSFSGFISYRPVVALFFFWDYFLWQEKAWGHHLTNILLHVLACVLLYILIFQITRKSGISFFACLLFSVHPIHSEVVCNIGYRSDLVSAVFTLLALVLYFRFWEGQRYKRTTLVLSYLSFLLALFSKETALTLPIILFFMDYWFCAQEGGRTFLMQRYKIYLGYLVVLGFYIAVYFFIMRNLFYGSSLLQKVDLGDRLILISTVFCNYLAALVLPWKVNVLPPLYIPHLMDEGIYVLVSLCLGLIFAGRILIRSREKTFWLLWFFITFVPVSNVIILLNPYAFRFMYLPSMGVFVILAYGIDLFLGSAQKRIKWKNFSMFAKATIVGLCVSLTVANNAFFKNSLVAAKEMVRNYPDSSRPYWILGVEYFEKGYGDKAIDHFYRYLSTNPRNPFVLDPKRNFAVFYILGRCHYPYGKKAVDFFKRAILLKPDYVLAYGDLIRLYKQWKEDDQANLVYEQAKKVFKDSHQLEYLKKIIDEK